MTFRNDLILNKFHKLPNISALLISPLSNPPLFRAALCIERPPPALQQRAGLIDRCFPKGNLAQEFRRLPLAVKAPF